MTKANRPEVQKLFARNSQISPSTQPYPLGPLESQRPLRSRGSNALILVADDDALVRFVCQRTLLEAGFRVVLATDGGEALTAFKAHHAQVAAVVLDRTMPVLTGEQVLEQIALAAPKMPVVVSTSETEPAVLALFQSDGPLVFLHKPWRSAHLLAALDAVLEGAHAT
jgi:two-component system, cell cycle sensor histidine kinase and response regulator CckA